jgi:PEP-CTERM motif
MSGKNLLRLVAILFFVTSPALADNFTYDFTILNAPDVGTFSWAVTVPGSLTVPGVENNFTPYVFTTFDYAVGPLNGGGCQISSVELVPGSFGGLSIDTNFSPLCQGGFDSTSAGLTVTHPNGLGLYTFLGHAPNGSVYTDILWVFDSDLPLTPFSDPSNPPSVPEPSTLLLLTAGAVLLLLRSQVPQALARLR